MKAPFTPITRGIERNIDDVAQSPGGLRDGTGFLIATAGRVDGIYRGAPRATFDNDYTPTRVIEWEGNTVQLDSNPTSNIVVFDGVTAQTGQDGSSRGVLYENVLPLSNTSVALSNMATVLVEPTLLESCFLSLTMDQGTYLSGTPAGANYTINFTLGAGLQPPAAVGTKTPQYVLFDRDADEGATSARIRPYIGHTVDGNGITTITYNGSAPPSGVVYVRILYGDTATDMFKPDGFYSHRERLAAWKDNDVYYSGDPGIYAIEPAPQDWSYWYALNQAKIGHSGQGKIVKCLTVLDTVMVFLEKAIYTISGYPPIDGAIDNQLVVRELVNGLGLIGYDGAEVSNDGQSVYFIGSDNELYAGNTAGIQRMSDKINLHPRFNRLTHVTTTDKYVAFSGTEQQPESVPSEISNKPGGLLYQSPAAWVYNLDLGAWSIVDQFATDNTGELIPTVHPTRCGVILRKTVNGKRFLAATEPGTLRVFNDPETRSPQLIDFYSMGIATHQVNLGSDGLKRPNAIDIVCEGIESAKLAATSPAENPAGQAPLDTNRVEPASQYGTTARFRIGLPEAPAHNYLSCAAGYWGEHLMAGQSDWTAALLGTSISAELNQTFVIDGFCSRLDLLLSNTGTCDITLKDASTGDTVYTMSYKPPQSGSFAAASYSWVPFGIRIKLPENVQMFISGTSTAYRYPNNDTIYNIGTPLYNGYSFCARFVKEAGAPFATRSIVSLGLEFDQVGTVSW